MNLVSACSVAPDPIVGPRAPSGSITALDVAPYCRRWRQRPATLAPTLHRKCDSSGRWVAPIEPGSWHGLDGDRRLALRRIRERGGVPWLTASKLPEPWRFKPFGGEEDTRAALPTASARRRARRSTSTRANSMEG